MIKDFGPLVRYYFLFGRDRVLVADPDIMKHILLTNSQNYIKPPNRIKYVTVDHCAVFDHSWSLRMKHIHSDPNTQSVSSSKWHVWFANHCLDKGFPTWQMIAVSCLTALVNRRNQTYCDLLGSANTQQLRRHNFYSRWTSLVELSSGPAAQSRHHLRTVQMTAEGTPYSRSMNTVFCASDMQCLRKNLLTCLLT